MNPLKNLFNKVFESTPPSDAGTPKEDSSFEWNPDEETVAATSSRATSWKRGDTADESPRRALGEATPEAIAASAHSLPTPEFERVKPSSRTTATPAIAPGPGPLAPTPAPTSDEAAPFISVKPTPAPAAIQTVPAVSPENWVRPSTPEAAIAVAPAAMPVPAPPQIPASDFEEVYRKAGIKSPIHGYGVERVYRLLTSRRLVGLDRNVRRSALLTALDAAGVPPSDVSQDAVLRRKALAAYEAEKALELQSLRSRNESRAEALQDTVETFTRQKQSQIERLAQGSTAAVRAQSDLEIRKRMEQDRLFRSLAYFVEQLPSPVAESRPALSDAARVIERFDATIEMRPFSREDAPAPEPPPVPADGDTVQEAAPSAAVVEAVTVTPIEPVEHGDTGADTRPLSQSGLEMALKAAAEEARNAGWGKAALVEDGASNPVDALKRLREGQKTDSES
jgi:hypothetical protein